MIKVVFVLEPMKLIILILISTFLLSMSNYQEGSVLCISKDGIELEKPLQICDHHSLDDDSIKDDSCDDHEISFVKTYQVNYKLKFINKTIKFINQIDFDFNYKYEISLKNELRKKINYNKIILYNQILENIRTTVILT